MILVSQTMTCCSEEMPYSTRCIHGFMSNLIKKSWTDSNGSNGMIDTNYVMTFSYTCYISEKPLLLKSFENMNCQLGS